MGHRSCRAVYAGLAVCFFLAPACDTGDDSNPTGSDSYTMDDFAGTWKGNVTLTGGIAEEMSSMVGVITLEKNAENSLTGTIGREGDPSTDNISGTVEGNVFSFSMTSASDHPDCETFEVNGTGGPLQSNSKMAVAASRLFCSATQGDFQVHSPNSNNHPFIVPTVSLLKRKSTVGTQL